MLHYILQVVAFQLLFLIIYDIFLRKETFFNLNRVYLLSTSVLSLIIPFIKIKGIKEVVAKDFVISLPEVLIGETTKVASTIDPMIAMEAGINLEPEPISIWYIILISGMCIAALSLIYKIIKLLLLVSNNPKRWSGKVLIVCLLNSTKAFSFFHYIFLGNRLTPKESTSILEHEMVHIKQKHSLDLLFFELLRIVFWFNPLVYIYQNRIATLHEYIADAKAIKGQNKAAYYDNLLTQVFDTQQFSFVNPFFKQSLIKKRIVMLSKSKSSRINLFKYVLLIPLVFTMLIYTSSYAQEKTKTPKVDENTTTTITEVVEIKELDTNSEIPFSIVEETPTFTFCEALPTNEERKACMSNHISKHVNRYFNTKLADSLGLVGRQRINVIFKIDKDGHVVDVKSRAPHPALEDEAVRVIKTLPQLVPGNQKGVAVVVPYSLPIIFQVAAKDPKPSIANQNTITHKKALNDAQEQLVDAQLNIIEFGEVDQVPLYEACSKLDNNYDQKLCVSKEISIFVNRNFNLDLASKLGLSGRQRMSATFIIDTLGNISNIKVRASHPELEKEVIRVISALPQFMPGKHNGKSIKVMYKLPIQFQIHGEVNKNKKN
nr:M56 family metallopeptidase [uncultured Psychroserpens sp.]